MAQKTKPKTPKQGGKLVGGYYKLPKAKNKTKLTRYGYSRAGSSTTDRAYQNEHYMRSGKFDSPNSKTSKKWKKEQTRSVSAAGATVATAGTTSGYLTHHIKNRNDKPYYSRQQADRKAIKRGKAGLAVSTALLGYSVYQQGKANKTIGKKTNTSVSALSGYYYRNQNGKRERVRFKSRVGNKAGSSTTKFRAQKKGYPSGDSKKTN